MSEYSDSLANAFRQEPPIIGFDTMPISSYAEENILIDSADGECEGWASYKTLKRAQD